MVEPVQVKVDSLGVIATISQTENDSVMVESSVMGELGELSKGEAREIGEALIAAAG